jgi:hypothetical protein
VPIYATAADLGSYVASNSEVTIPTATAAEALLERAERDVDRVVGPWPVFSNGLAYESQPPTTLGAQVTTLGEIEWGEHRPVERVAVLG